MSKCPFGYKAEEPASDEEEDTVDDEDEKVTDEANDKAGGEGEIDDPDIISFDKKGKKKVSTGKAPKRFDYEADPVGWFYQNQIRSEEEFQAKRLRTQRGRRQRLEGIMAAKGKVLEFDPRLEEDKLSIASSELSELDSDTHSLKSLRSCAESWIEEAEYKKPAEGWIKFWAPSAAFPLIFCAFQWYDANATFTRISKGPLPINIQHILAALMALMVGVTLLAGLIYYAASVRSKRALVLGQIGMLAMYALSAAITTAIIARPFRVDLRVSDRAPGKCSRGMDNRMPIRGEAIPLCSVAQLAIMDVASLTDLIFSGSLALGVTALLLTGFGVWYLFELAYMEKKASRHKRRHRRNKGKIPWHKIKIVGPVTDCGSGAKTAAAAAANAAHGIPAGGAKKTSGCPVMH